MCPQVCAPLSYSCPPTVYIYGGCKYTGIVLLPETNVYYHKENKLCIMLF